MAAAGGAGAGVVVGGGVSAGVDGRGAAFLKQLQLTTDYLVGRYSRGDDVKFRERLNDFLDLVRVLYEPDFKAPKTLVAPGYSSEYLTLREALIAAVPDHAQRLVVLRQYIDGLKASLSITDIAFGAKRILQEILNSITCIALVDVDETLILGTNTVNERLIAAIKAKGIRDIYLFTNMEISADLIAKWTAADSRPEDRGLTRYELVQRLKDVYALNVLGVITPADPGYIGVADRSYDGGYAIAYLPPRLGVAYDVYYGPLFTDAAITADNRSTDPKYKALCSDYDECRARAADIKGGRKSFDPRTIRGGVVGEAKRHADVKGVMYEYFLACLPSESRGACLVFDDGAHCLGAVQATHMLRDKGLPPLCLATVLVDKTKQDTQDYMASIDAACTAGGFSVASPPSSSTAFNSAAKGGASPGCTIM